MVFICKAGDMRTLRKCKDLSWASIGESQGAQIAKQILDEDKRILIAMSFLRGMSVKAHG